MPKEQVDYSPAERLLLELIPKNGAKTTIDELTRRRYSKGQTPFNSMAIVRATLAQLMRKVDYNRESFRIRKGRRMGPRPSEVWREERRGR